MNIPDKLEDQAKWCSVEEAGLLREAAGEIRMLERGIIAMGANNEQLRAELAACREDAERYRWLKDNVPLRYEVSLSSGLPPGFDSGLEIDEMIDVARKGEGE